MATTLSIEILFSPSSTSVGKYYIAVLDPNVHFSINGANTPRNGGQVNNAASLKKMQSTVAAKKRDSYTNTVPSNVPRPALDKMVEEILQRLNLPRTTGHRIDTDGRHVHLLTDSATPTPPSTGGARGRRPPRQESQNMDVWF